MTWEVFMPDGRRPRRRLARPPLQGEKAWKLYGTSPYAMLLSPAAVPESGLVSGMRVIALVDREDCVVAFREGEDGWKVSPTGSGAVTLSVVALLKRLGVVVDGDSSFPFEMVDVDGERLPGPAFGTGTLVGDADGALRHERGRRNEARALDLLASWEGRPAWIESARLGDRAEDARGWDLVVSTDVGRIGLQVKSSKGEARSFAGRRPGVPVVVVNEGMPDEVARRQIAKALGAARETYLMICGDQGSK